MLAPSSRRSALQRLLVFAATLVAPRAGRAADPAVAVEQAHAEIWRRFIDGHGVMLDFTDLDGAVNLPTPEECRAGQPNALGWWAPIENGAMFNGLYMDAAVLRWQHTQSSDDAAKARRLMEGLLLLNSVSDVPGFVARGVSTDGKSHYAMGSNDQTMPWFFGLWRYLKSGLAAPSERARIVAQLTTTADAIVSLGWKMPAEAPFGTRGSFAGFTFDTAPRQLFVAKLLHGLTGEAKWATIYREELDRRGGAENLSKLEICARGMVYEYAKTHNWTSCTAVAAIRGLWEMESDPARKAAYAQGLQASAKLAVESFSLAEKFDHGDDTTFTSDWRTPMLPLWQPQQTEAEAQDLAHAQLREFLKVAPRRGQETAFNREPTSAAWIVTLCPDPATVRAHAAAIEAVITKFDYARLYYCTFFWVEAAWWRLQAARKS